MHTTYHIIIYELLIRREICQTWKETRLSTVYTQWNNSKAPVTWHLSVTEDINWALGNKCIFHHHYILSYSDSCTSITIETTNKSLTLCSVLIFLGIPSSGTSSTSLLEGLFYRYLVVFLIFLFPRWFHFNACLVMLWPIFKKKCP